MCAQPCRKPYTLVTGDRDGYGRPKRIRELPTAGHYLLSPKDLCTFRYLPELVRSPVISLKIEGRMKSPEYVAVVVSTYRRALDAIAQGDWKPSPAAEQDLLLAFNRGFTRGYLLGDRHGTLMARGAPDNRGICIGTIVKQDGRNRTVTVHLNGTLVPGTGDGLLFSDPAKGQEDWGFLLNNSPLATGEKTVTFGIPRPVAPGTSVSVTSSRDLEARARQIIAHPPADLVRRVPVDLRISVDDGGHISMEGRLETGSGNEVRVSYQPDFSLVPARSRPLSCDQLEAQVRRSGDTPFLIRHCSISYDGSLFAPVGELNRMRREFLSRAADALLASSLPSEEECARSRQRLAAFRSHAATTATPGENASTTTPLAITVYADTPDIVSMAVKEGCTGICFEPAFVLPRHSCQEVTDEEFRSIGQQVTEAMALCRNAGIRFMLKLPRITRDDYLGAVLPEISRLHAEGLASCMVENPGAAHAVHTHIPDMALHGASGLGIFNHRSACHLSPPFQSLTLSPELSRDECQDLVRAARKEGCSASFALIVQGVSEAMITEDCLLEPVQHCGAGRDGNAFFGIRDATGHIFPFMTDGECRTRIGNAVETCLVDHLPAIRRAGISEVVIDARGRTGAYASAMTRIYRDETGQDISIKGREDQHGLLKERIKALAMGGITAGHFLRGLKE